MLDAVISKQLIIRVTNDVGTLAEVTSIVGQYGINMTAINASAIANEGVIMFVSEDNEQAKEILKAQDYEVREEEVVLVTVDNAPGRLQAVCEKIAEAKIDLTIIYGSVAQDGSSARLVMIAEDNRALRVAALGKA